MFEYFVQNPLFKRVIEVTEDLTIKSQILKLIETAHDRGIDWYFTEIPDLRCGRKNIGSFRADEVLFSVQMTAAGMFVIRAWRELDLAMSGFPLNEQDLEKMLQLIESFARRTDFVKTGRLPPDYTLFDISTSFDLRVATSLSGDPAQRKHRLKIASKFPQRRLVQVFVFDRNPDVVAEVLSRAGGKCEKCKRDAPFSRRHNDQPYLEVHHAIPLSEGGPDSVENAVALCPNCHRQLHYGKLVADKLAPAYPKGG